MNRKLILHTILIRIIFIIAAIVAAGLTAGIVALIVSNFTQNIDIIVKSCLLGVWVAETILIVLRCRIMYGKK
jgi:hypothetical protein